MRWTGMVALLLAGLVGQCAFGGETVWRDSFTDKSLWPEKTDHNGTLKFAYGVLRSGMPSALCVSGTTPWQKGMHWTKADTEWTVTSAKIPLKGEGPKFAISLRVGGVSRLNATIGLKTYNTHVLWYDEAGDYVGSRGIPMVVPMDGKAHDVRMVGEVPAGAALFAVRLGFDAPDLYAGDEAWFSDLKLERLDVAAVCGDNTPDLRPPRIRLASASPTTDAAAPVRLSITDGSGVDWKTVSVAIDGHRVGGRREGDEFVVERPSEPYAAGLHAVSVRAVDVCGNTNDATKAFFVGKDPETPAVTVRADGVVLVGGKPFFPIGVYDVRKRAFNAYDFDRACADLKDVGINTIHTYGSVRQPGFLEAVRRHGLKLWTEGNPRDAYFRDELRHNPDVLAWYIGDDTSSKITVERLYDRDDNLRALDPTRITVQADLLWPDSPVDVYEDFAGATDGFLPEIYPVIGDGEEAGDNCVAAAINTMERIHEDNARKGGGRPHTVWPIIQHFKGWTYKRFPTGTELYAMSMAAIVHGANGITWYTYGGKVDPEKKEFNYGVTASEEIWRDWTNVTRRVSALAPVLLGRTVPQPAAPTVLLGPRRDANGRISVSALMKRHDGALYLLAVNATRAKVRARLSVGVSGRGAVLYEGRSVTSSAGSFEDDFGGFGCHVYRFEAGDTK